LSTALGIRLTVISSTVTREFEPCNSPIFEQLKTGMSRPRNRWK